MGIRPQEADFLAMAEYADLAAARSSDPGINETWERIAEDYRTLAGLAGIRDTSLWQLSDGLSAPPH